LRGKSTEQLVADVERANKHVGALALRVAGGSSERLVMARREVPPEGDAAGFTRLCLPEEQDAARTCSRFSSSMNAPCGG